METLAYNDNVEIGYEYEPIYASSNAFTGTRYRTKIYLLQGRSRYALGDFDGKLDEEAIKLNIEDIMREGQGQKYGQQQTALRKDLQPQRDGSKTGNTSQQISHADMRGKSILHRRD